MKTVTIWSCPIDLAEKIADEYDTRAIEAVKAGNENEAIENLRKAMDLRIDIEEAKKKEENDV